MIQLGELLGGLLELAGGGVGKEETDDSQDEEYEKNKDSD